MPVTAGSETRWGGSIGAGLEFAFTPNWSLGLEYDNLFLGSHDVTLTSLFVDTIRIHQDVDMGLVRLNYHFGAFGSAIDGHYWDELTPAKLAGSVLRLISLLAVCASEPQ